MKYSAFAFLSILGLISASCSLSSSNKAKEEAELEIQASLDYINRCYDSIQYVKLYSLSDEVYEQYEWFKSNYRDTSNRSFWIYELSYLQRVERSIRKSRGDSSAIADALNLSRSQLISLSNSYSKGELDSLSFHTYLLDEQNALQELQAKIRLRHIETKEGLDKWTRLKPILDSTRQYVSNL